MGLKLEKPSNGQAPLSDEDLEKLKEITEGGPGSGNRGHAGRPGERGGSAPGDAGGKVRSVGSNDNIKNATEVSHAELRLLPQSDIAHIDAIVVAEGEDFIHEVNKEMAAEASPNMERMTEEEASTTIGIVVGASKKIFINASLLKREGVVIHETGHIVMDNATALEQRMEIRRIYRARAAAAAKDVEALIRFFPTVYSQKNSSEFFAECYMLYHQKEKREILDKEMRSWFDNFYKKSEQVLEGGPGSGNFDHAGRPGEVGGSGEGAASSNSPTREQLDKAHAVFKAFNEGTVLATLADRQMRGGILRGNKFTPFTPASKSHNLSRLVTEIDKLRDRDPASFELARRWDLADRLQYKSYDEIPDVLTVYRGHDSSETTLPRVINVTHKRDVAVHFGGIVSAFRTNKSDIVFSLANSVFDEGELIVKRESLTRVEESLSEGGPGSGNFDHSGRPGEVGGSAPDGAAVGSTKEGGGKIGVDKFDADYSKISKVDRMSQAELHDITANKAANLKDINADKISGLVSVSGRITQGTIKASVSNAKAVLNHYSKYLSSDSYGKARDLIDNFHERLSQVDEFVKIDAADINALMQDSMEKLVYQEVESNRQSFTDHGIRHIVSNIERSDEIMEALSGGEVSSMDRLMNMFIMVNHDIGYTTPLIREGGFRGVQATADHKEFSAKILEQQRPTWNEGKIFTSEQYDKIVDVVLKHDAVTVDESDVLSASIALSDNLAIFASDKLPSAFANVDGGRMLLVRMGTAAKNGDLPAFDKVKNQMYASIDSTSRLSANLKRDLKMAVSTMSKVTPKFTLGVLAGKITKISGNKNLEIEIEHSEWDSFLQKYFDMGQRQTKKLLESYGIKEFDKTEYWLGKKIRIRVRKKGRVESLSSKVSAIRNVVQEGGPGSGNFDHAGRPGEVGGSGEGGGAITVPKFDKDGKYPIYHFTSDLYIDSIMSQGIGQTKSEIKDTGLGKIDIIYKTFPEGFSSWTRDPNYSVGRDTQIRFTVADKSALGLKTHERVEMLAPHHGEYLPSEMVPGTFEHEEGVTGVVPFEKITRIDIAKSLYGKMVRVLGAYREYGKRNNGAESKFWAEKAAPLEKFLSDKRLHIGLKVWRTDFSGKRKLVDEGGPTSGNYGHSGRPGEVGGSSPGDGTKTSGVGVEVKTARVATLEKFEKALKQIPSLHRSKLSKVTIMSEADVRSSYLKRNPKASLNNFDVVRGFYDVSEKEVVVAAEHDENTIYHEVGHHVWYNELSVADRGEWTAQYTECEKNFVRALSTDHPISNALAVIPSMYARSNPREFFAECYRLYVEIRVAGVTEDKGISYITRWFDKSRFKIEPLRLKIRKTAEEQITEGGPGSGNYGHTGRPGEVGGSGGGGTPVSVRGFSQADKTWTNALNDKERTVCQHYLTDWQDLRELDKRGESSQDLSLLKATVKKAPLVSSSSVYRGFAVRTDEEMKQFASGKVFKLNAISSFSENEKVAEQFAAMTSQDNKRPFVLMEVRNPKSAHSIKGLGIGANFEASSLRDKEALMFKDTRYKIVSVVKDVELKGYTSTLHPETPRGIKITVEEL